MRVFVKNILSDARIVTGGIIAASVLALISALIAEYIFGLQPCVLCIYQRILYVLTTLVGFGGLFFALKGKTGISILCVLTAAFIFLGEAGLAFYHVGVEQHWWVSAIEGCKVSFGDSAESILARIQNTAAVRCDEIPWEMFGISMAGYNAMLALCLCLGCFISAWLITKCPESL